MAREERTSTAMSSSTSISNPQRIPSEVYQQLTKDFVPAVKNATHAGTELLRNYQALEKSSEVYALALENLAKSSHTADLKAQGYGRDLHEILQTYKSYIEYHKECTKELTSIVNKITTFSNEEKEKLKETFGAYQKGEKDIQKAIKKNTKNNEDLTTYYNKSAHEFLRMQELRYKFFLDKHKRWFGKYWDLMGKIQTERGVISNGHAAAPEKPAEKIPTNDAPIQIIESAIVHNGIVDETPTEEEHKPAIVPPIGENGTDDNPPFLDTRNSSSRSSVSSMGDNIPSRRPTNEDIPGVTLIHSERRPQDERRSSAIQEYKFEHMPPAHVVRTAVQADPIPVQQPTPLVRDEVIPAAVPPAQKKFEYTGPIIMPAPVPRTREPEIIKQRDVVMMVPRTVDAPVYAPLKQENVNRYVAPPVERPHYHVESEYNPSVSPAHRPVPQNFAKPAEQLVVPSMFNASDYGRTLTVTQDFNATSGEQMTVNRGDKVILIKSGTRGWIFIQDQATQRTGWIPAPFVAY